MSHDLQQRLNELQQKYVEVEDANKRLNAQLSELYALYAAANIVSRNLDLREFSKGIKSLFSSHLPMDRFMLLLRRRTTESFRLVAGVGAPSTQDTGNGGSGLNANRQFYEDLITSGDYLHIPDLASFEARAQVPGLADATGSYFAYPFSFKRPDGQGVLEYWRSEPNILDEIALETLKKVSELIVQGFRNVIVFEETRALSIKDELTGIYNRRHFNHRFDVEILRAKRYNHPLSVVVLDIDHFKNFNDINGHLLGDQALKAVAQALRSNLRKADILARYGGEEFVVILPEISKDRALTVADKLRWAVESRNIEGEQNLPSRNLTISLGVANFPDDGDEATALLDRGDKALYRAKQFGRNQSCAFNPARDLHPSHESSGMIDPQGVPVSLN